MQILFEANCWNNSCGIFQLKNNDKEVYWSPLRITLLESKRLLNLEYGNLPKLTRTLSEISGKFAFEKEDMVEIMKYQRIATS